MEENSNTNPYDVINDSITRANDPDSYTRNVFDDFFMPGISQQIEFGQQAALQKMQNDWSVSGKMKAGKAAGINPYTLAEGIAGASSGSASAPNSAIGAGAQGLASAAQAAQAVTGAVDTAANAYEKFSLTGVENDRRKAETQKLLSEVLHNKWLAYSISELLPEQKANQRADTYLKLAEFDKAREEKLLIKKRVDEAQAHIDELKEQTRLYEQQGNLVMMQQTKTLYEAEQISLQNDKLQWDKDWRARYRYDPNAPVDVALEQSMVNGSGSDVVDNIGAAVNTFGYEANAGNLSAEASWAFEVAKNRQKGVEESEKEYRENRQWFAEHEIQMKEFYQWLYSNPKDFREAFFKYIGSWNHALRGDNIYNQEAKNLNK